MTKLFLLSLLFIVVIPAKALDITPCQAYGGTCVPREKCTFRACNDEIEFNENACPGDVDICCNDVNMSQCELSGGHCVERRECRNCVFALKGSKTCYADSQVCCKGLPEKNQCATHGGECIPSEDCPDIIEECRVADCGVGEQCCVWLF